MRIKMGIGEEKVTSKILLGKGWGEEFYLYGERKGKYKKQA